MKFLKLNWHTFLCTAMVLAIFSCTNEGEISPKNDDNTSSDEIYLQWDNTEEELSDESSRITAGGTLKYVSVWLNREEFAVGYFRIRVARASDDALIRKSLPVDVSILPIHSTSSKKYMKVNMPVEKSVNTGTEYKIDLICEGCLAENKRRVNWWYSRDNDYAEGAMYTQHNLKQPDYDFSFNVVYEPTENERYNCAFNHEKYDVYAFNFEDARVSQTFRIGTPIEFADDDLKREAQLNLGLTYDQPVMTYAALSLTEFRSAYTFVEDLSGIEYFRNLTTLQFHVSHLTNVDLLSNLTKLEHLDLRYNDIEDVRALGALTNLRYLNLEGNLLTDAEVRDLENVLGIDVIF